MRGRVLRRPIGGWGARQWRREVAGWLWLAFLFITAGAACSTVYRTIEFVSEIGNAHSVLRDQ